MRRRSNLNGELKKYPMEIRLTKQFLSDLRSLSHSLGNKCQERIGELHSIEPSKLRQKALPGWRLHNLRGSNMVSLSLDMNFRILAQFDHSALVLHRVVKHDSADRATVNRNDQAEAIAQMTSDEILPGDVYDALLSFGVELAEVERFRECSTEDDLLSAVAHVSEGTANLALALYETSGLAIPRAGFRAFQRNDDLARLLEAGGSDWQIYLHPSQTYLVELPPSFRAAVVGSAGTGKTVCAWYRSKRLIDLGVSVGFVCPHESVLDISKKNLLHMVGAQDDRSFFFVPKQPDELMQLAEAVDHVIIDEAQEFPATWLVKLADTMRDTDTLGLTLFYDFNQLGGNIPNNDTSRYRRRISDWKAVLNRFPKMQKFRLDINYRNAREIAECYLELLAGALPAKPLADVPVFESGQVLQHKIRHGDLYDVLTSLLHRLLKDHSTCEIGIVTLDQRPKQPASYFGGTEAPGFRRSPNRRSCGC